MEKWKLRYKELIWLLLDHKEILEAFKRYEVAMNEYNLSQ